MNMKGHLRTHILRGIPKKTRTEQMKDNQQERNCGTHLTIHKMTKKKKDLKKIHDVSGNFLKNQSKIKIQMFSLIKQAIKI